MRRRLIYDVIGLGILGVGGYAAYTYAMNMIADKIANQLVVEGGTSQQWLESIDLPAIAETAGISSSVTPTGTEKAKAPLTISPMETLQLKARMSR